MRQSWESPGTKQKKVHSLRFEVAKRMKKNH